MPMAKIKTETIDKKLFIAVGDIHGCHRELSHLIAVLEDEYNLEDPMVQVVFMGDYIDRGDSSVKVIQILLEFRQKHPQTIFLKGNHELSFLEDQVRTFNDIPEPTPRYIDDFLNGLQIYYDTPHFLFVHGGPSDSNSDLETDGEHELLWNYIPDHNGWQDKVVVKGHTAVKRPTLLQRVLYLDSGCCFGGALSCAILDAQSGEVLEYKQVKRASFIGKGRRQEDPANDDNDNVIVLKTS